MAGKTGKNQRLGMAERKAIGNLRYCSLRRQLVEVMRKAQRSHSGKKLAPSDERNTCRILPEAKIGWLSVRPAKQIPVGARWYFARRPDSQKYCPNEAHRAEEFRESWKRQCTQQRSRLRADCD